MVRMETNVDKSCVECRSAIEGDKVLINLKGILLSERNQSQKFSFVYKFIYMTFSKNTKVG